MSLMCSVVSVYMALFFMEDMSSDPDAETNRDTLVLSENVKLAMFIVIFLANISFMF